MLLVKVKNKFLKGQEFEIITPDEQYFTCAESIIDTKTGEETDVANTNGEMLVKLKQLPKNYEYALARTKEIKNDDIAS